MRLKAKMVLGWTIALLVGLVPIGQAQGVRSLGMGGLVLPGPEGADRNPAYAAYPSRYGREGTMVPLGLLRFLPTFPDTSPFTYFTDRQAFKTGFDALSFYDQLTHPNSFLLNHARSPDEVVFRIRADRLEIADGQGNPLAPSFALGAVGAKPTALYPPPLYWIPLWSEGGIYFRFGPFLGVEGLQVSPSRELAQALAGGNLDACRQDPSPCTLSATAKASSGVALDLGWAAALPEVPEVGQLYVGVRGQGFYGLGYVEVNAEARPIFDPDGNPSAVDYQVGGFYSIAYAPQGSGLFPGRGYGLRGDVGVVLDMGQATLGLGVQNLLSLVTWEGYAFSVDQNGNLTQTPAKRQGDIFAPSLFLNGAYHFQDLGLLLGADASFGATAPSFHLGGEYALGLALLRAGVGYEGGFRFGLGAGFDLEGLGLDLALTRHEAPLVGGSVYGIALAVRF
ncbi:hypothetical protein [Thermus sp.]|uniref:hypothetical protein n=1 Tax=Thermus sp. TaxID=275 RepID=UPI00307E7DBA